MKWILRNYIKAKREFKIFYKKGKKVLLKIILGNIKKKKSNLKKLVKGDWQATKVVKDFTFILFFPFYFLALKSFRLYFTRQYFLDYTFLQTFLKQDN